MTLTGFGLIEGRCFRTVSSASSAVRLVIIITYAIAIAPDRDWPCSQWMCAGCRILLSNARTDLDLGDQRQMIIVDTEQTTDNRVPLPSSVRLNHRRRVRRCGDGLF